MIYKFSQLFFLILFNTVIMAVSRFELSL